MLFPIRDTKSTHSSGENRKSSGDKNSSHDKSGHKHGHVPSSHSKSAPQGEQPVKRKLELKCRGCGHKHATENCFGKGNHKIVGYNHNPSIEWEDSPEAKAFPGLKALPMENIWAEVDKRAKLDKSKPEKKHKGESPLPFNYQYVLHLNNGNNLFGSTWPINIAVPGTNVSYNVNALFDSGALQANYGSYALQDKLIAEGLEPSPCSDLVCSAFGECRRCRSQFFLFVTLINDLGIQKNISHSSKNYRHRV